MCTGDCTYMFHHVVEDYTIIPCTYNFINLTTGVLVTVPHSNIWSLDLRNNTVPFLLRRKDLEDATAYLPIHLLSISSAILYSGI